MLSDRNARTLMLVLALACALLIVGLVSCGTAEPPPPPEPTEAAVVEEPEPTEPPEATEAPAPTEEPAATEAPAPTEPPPPPEPEDKGIVMLCTFSKPFDCSNPPGYCIRFVERSWFILSQSCNFDIASAVIYSWTV